MAAGDDHVDGVVGFAGTVRIVVWIKTCVDVVAAGGMEMAIWGGLDLWRSGNVIVDDPEEAKEVGKNIKLLYE